MRPGQLSGWWCTSAEVRAVEVTYVLSLKMFIWMDMRFCRIVTNWMCFYSWNCISKNVMGVAVLLEHFSNLFHFISIKPIEVERQLEFNWQMKVNHCLLNTNCRTTTCFIEDTDVFVNSLVGKYFGTKVILVCKKHFLTFRKIVWNQTR